MASLSKREIKLLVVLVIALAFLAYYNFFLKAYFAQTEEIKTQTVDVIRTINEAKVQKGTVLLIEKRIVEVEEQMAQYSSKMSRGVDDIKILNDLNTVLGLNAVDTTISFSSTYNDLGSNYTVDIGIEFKCTQQGYLNVLTGFRSARFINRIVDSSLSIPTDNSDNCMAQIILEVMTYSDSAIVNGLN